METGYKDYMVICKSSAIDYFAPEVKKVLKALIYEPFFACDFVGVAYVLPDSPVLVEVLGSVLLVESCDVVRIVQA